LIYSGDQLNPVEGFHNTPKAPVSTPRIAGHKQNRQVGVEFQNTIRQLETIHLRHSHIGKQERNTRPVSVIATESFVAVGSGYYGVSGMLQESLSEGANVEVIVHYQDRVAMCINLHSPSLYRGVSPISRPSSPKPCFDWRRNKWLQVSAILGWAVCSKLLTWLDWIERRPATVGDRAINRAG
jgi:hypothetical protein